MLRILTMLAMVLASFSMLGGHAAMAAPAASTAMDHASMDHAAPAIEQGADAAGHCADMDGTSPNQPMADIDCMIACTALPTIGSDYAFERLPISPVRSVPPATGISGIDLQADPPPPRLS